MNRVISISFFLVFSLTSLSRAQSVYMKTDENAFSLSLGQSSSDFVANKIYSASAIFTRKGRFDYGLLYATYDNIPIRGFGARADVFTPTIHYLLIKQEDGPNIGAGVGYNFVANSVDVNDFVLSANISQRIGKIDKTNVLPFFAISTSNGETAKSIGISLVFPKKNYFIISPSFVSSNGDSNFSFELGYIFSRQAEK